MIRFTCNDLRSSKSDFVNWRRSVSLRGVARQLIRLQKQVGSGQKGEPEIGFSRESVAQMTGATLPTVSALLSAWDEHGLVNSRRKCSRSATFGRCANLFEDH
jgi:hypothetical protein